MHFGHLLGQHKELRQALGLALARLPAQHRYGALRGEQHPRHQLHQRCFAYPVLAKEAYYSTGLQR